MKYPAAFIIAALICFDASADVQMTMAEKDLETARGSKTQISVRNGKVLFQESGNGDFSAIFNSADGSLTQIDHASRSYMVVDKQTMKDSMSQISEMMKQVEEQLANLPKEQREAMMKAMPGLGDRGKAQAAPTEFEWTGEKKEVAGFPCRIARVTRAGKDAGDACIAKPRDLGMSVEDFEALASMFEVMAEFASEVSGDDSMPDMRKIGGFPIAASDPESGTSSALISASDAALDGALFEIPAGYRQQTMPQF